MKIRTWINLITIVFLVLLVYLSWGQITKAWALLGEVDLRIYALMVPVQFFSYYAIGEVMFSYLRAKGELGDMSRWGMTRVALELNFVNHIIPVSGIAGFSYMGVILKPHGVTPGRSTMAQLIRYSTMFVTFVLMIIISVLILSFDQEASRLVIIISGAFVLATIVSAILLIYSISSHKRLVAFSRWSSAVINRIVEKLSLGKTRQLLRAERVEKFFTDIHNDYLEIIKDKRILFKPLLWSLASNILDISLIFIAFLSLGAFINPATLVIACGISSFLGIFSATPGGAGVYEAIMITFLASAGISPDVAIAGTLLARVTVLVGTIVFGFFFYQLTLNKYGKVGKPNNGI